MGGHRLPDELRWKQKSEATFMQKSHYFTLVSHLGRCYSRGLGSGQAFQIYLQQSHREFDLKLEFLGLKDEWERKRPGRQDSCVIYFITSSSLTPLVILLAVILAGNLTEPKSPLLFNDVRGADLLGIWAH